MFDEKVPGLSQWIEDYSHNLRLRTSHSSVLVSKGLASHDLFAKCVFKNVHLCMLNIHQNAARSPFDPYFISMAFPIFLALVSMALAAPQLSQSAKNLQLTEPSFTPTSLPLTNDGTPTLQAVDLPIPFIPPPLSLQHGGEHVYVPIPRPGRNPVPSPFRPQRLNLLNGGDLRTPIAAPRPSLERRDDDASVSPPLILSIGGERTLNSLPSPALPKRDAQPHLQLRTQYSQPSPPRPTLPESP